MKFINLCEYRGFQLSKITHLIHFGFEGFQVVNGMSRYDHPPPLPQSEIPSKKLFLYTSSNHLCAFHLILRFTNNLESFSWMEFIYLRQKIPNSAFGLMFRCFGLDPGGTLLGAQSKIKPRTKTQILCSPPPQKMNFQNQTQKSHLPAVNLKILTHTPNLR